MSSLATNHTEPSNDNDQQSLSEENGKQKAQIVSTDNVKNLDSETKEIDNNNEKLEEWQILKVKKFLENNRDNFKSISFCT